jgi:hypothetical protein
MRKFVAIFLFVTFLVSGPSLAKENISLATVKLLEGYSLETHLNQDTEGGRITKKNGLKIEICVGEMMDLYAQPSKRSNFEWFQTQSINGNLVYLALTPPDVKDARTLEVSFPTCFANFSVKVSSQADVAEALAMILTYKPTH